MVKKLGLEPLPTIHDSHVGCGQQPPRFRVPPPMIEGDTRMFDVFDLEVNCTLHPEGGKWCDGLCDVPLPLIEESVRTRGRSVRRFTSEPSRDIQLLMDQRVGLYPWDGPRPSARAVSEAASTIVLATQTSGYERTPPREAFTTVFAGLGLEQGRRVLRLPGWLIEHWVSRGQGNSTWAGWLAMEHALSTARSWAEVGEAGGVTEATARHFGGLVDRKLAYMTPEWTLFTARGRSLTELALLWGLSRSGACKKRQRAHLALHGGVAA